jgi:lipopolysaccharide/colanic/teichoic acid biosynthesis glycosyltransferase
MEQLSEDILKSVKPNRFYMGCKRGIDWIIALTLSVLLSPLFIVAALAIKCETSGPILYSQRRIGFRGAPFIIYKFRTMQTCDTSEADDKDRAMTRPDDARVTRVGRFLRQTRFDELPQLINILKGDMSWIGPRPESESLSHWYSEQIAFYHYRHIVRPGITGWAQVNQGHVTSIDDVMKKLRYDLHYVCNLSWLMDIHIIFRTIHVVMTGAGAR